MSAPARNGSEPWAVRELRSDEVHLWRVSLDEPPLPRARLLEVLSPDERARADRFAFERHRDRFVSCRGVLRYLLGGYLGTAPEALRFAYGPHGKPRVDGPTGLPSIEFNLSHAEGLAVYALAAREPLGIDIELEREIEEVDTIASRFFSARESRALAALPKDERRCAFLRCWTRKEAWLKASGAGLADGLDRVEVTFLPGEEARLLAVPGGDRSRWDIQELTPVPGVTGALVVDRGGAGPDLLRTTAHVVWPAVPPWEAPARR